MNNTTQKIQSQDQEVGEKQIFLNN